MSKHTHEIDTNEYTYDDEGRFVYVCQVCYKELRSDDQVNSGMK